MAPSDAELVKRTLEGDPKAFEQLVRRYQGLVFSIIYHYLGSRNEVEDIAQEVFLKVFRSLGSYDPKRPLKAWISKITSNSCLDEIRRAKVKNERVFSDLGEEEQRRLDFFYGKFKRGEGFNESEAERLMELLQQLLGLLGDSERTAFVLREMEGQEYAEIAEALGTTELAVRIRVSRARKRLIEGLRAYAGGGGVTS